MARGDVAGSSRRCDECKRRRKKCDLQEPQCHRCRVSGIRCSGPKSSTIFVHSQPDTMLGHTSRQRLVDAHQRRSTESGRSQRFYQLSVHSLLGARSTLVRHEYQSSLPRDDAVLSGRLALWEPLYHEIVGEFTNTSTSGIFSGDRNTRQGTKHYSGMALTIRALLPLAAKYVPVLDIAIFSLLAIYYGRLHANSGLVHLARTAYVATLSELRRYLLKVTNMSARTSHVLKALCCTSITLCCFEHLDAVATLGFGYIAHFDGALRLLQSCGPTMVLGSPALKSLLKGFRLIVLHISLHRRRSTFLSKSVWNQEIFDDVDSTVRDRLITMAFEIPELLEQTDNLKTSVSTVSSSSGNATVILSKIRSLRARFRSWLEELNESIEGDLYWPLSKQGVGAPHFLDTECKPTKQNNLQQLNFASGTIAGLLAHYWSLELTILVAEAKVQNSLETKGTASSAASKSTRADETVQHILEAQPYLTSCLEGTICMQLVIGHVENYFALSGTVLDSATISPKTRENLAGQ